MLNQDIRNHFTSSSTLPSSRETERRILNEYVRQVNTAFTQSWNPLGPEHFISQTELGKKLWEIKKKMIENGETTSDWSKVISLINDARGTE
jgi:hypothetical protein